MKTIGFLTGLVLLTALASGAVADDKAIIGAWLFDKGEGTTVADASGNGNDGAIVHPEYVEWTNARGGKGLAFSGEGYRKEGGVYIRKLKNYDPAKAMTIEAWVKLDPDSKSSDYQYIANQGPNKGPGFWFGIAYHKLHFRTGNGATTWGVKTRAEHHGGGFEKGRWYHVVATWDGKHYALYIDGEEIASVEEERAITVGPDCDLAIGCYGNGIANHFDGVIAELRLYNYARSSEQIIRAARLD